jgi:hypothetical protein
MEQGDPKQVINEQSYGIFVPYEAKCHCNADWAKHRNEPPFRAFQECGVLPGPNAAYHPYSSPDCATLLQASPVLHVQARHCGVLSTSTGVYTPVLFTSFAPYPPPYMYQPMAPQLAAYATQTSYYMYPPGTVPGPTVCNIPVCLVDPPNEIPQLMWPPLCGRDNIAMVNLMAGRQFWPCTGQAFTTRQARGITPKIGTMATESKHTTPTPPVHHTPTATGCTYTAVSTDREAVTALGKASGQSM